MHTKANHFKIGVFVVTAVALLVVAVVMLARPRMKKPMHIETYMDESVAGLNVGSPITYRGVEIGRVEGIEFVASRYDTSVELGRYVVIDMVIERDLLLGKSNEDAEWRLDKLVSKGLRIRLTTNPLTGLAYLEADYPMVPSKQLPIEGWEPKHYYLPSDKSVLNKFSQSALSAFERLEQIDIVGLVDRLDKLLETFDNAVADADIQEISRMFKEMLVEIQQTSERLKSLMASDSQVDMTFADVLAKIDEALGHIDRLTVTQGPDIVKIMDDLREFSANIRELSEELRMNPVKLISRPAKSEVVE